MASRTRPKNTRVRAAIDKLVEKFLNDVFVYPNSIASLMCCCCCIVSVELALKYLLLGGSSAGFSTLKNRSNGTFLAQSMLVRSTQQAFTQTHFYCVSGNGSRNSLSSLPQQVRKSGYTGSIFLAPIHQK